LQYKSSLEPAVNEDVRQSGTCRLGIAKQGFFEVNVAFQPSSVKTSINRIK
jgi:hypothetical protein